MNKDEVLKDLWAQLAEVAQKEKALHEEIEKAGLTADIAEIGQHEKKEQNLMRGIADWQDQIRMKYLELESGMIKAELLEACPDIATDDLNLAARVLSFEDMNESEELNELCSRKNKVGADTLVLLSTPAVRSLYTKLAGFRAKEHDLKARITQLEALKGEGEIQIACRAHQEGKNRLARVEEAKKKIREVMGV